MQDISLHLLDIIENSVRAQAKNIIIEIDVELLRNRLKISISDDGTGMDKETLLNSQDPFYTSKSERQKKVGLGIPLFKQSAEMCHGSFFMESELGKGTKIEAVFEYDYVDRMPLGKINDTMLGCVVGHSDVDFRLLLRRKTVNNKMFEFVFDTAEIKQELDGIPITYPDVVMYMQELLKEGMTNTKMEEI
jgi:anti-sigma regulatory factor (Ser/Thr protein kinase)